MALLLPASAQAGFQKTVDPAIEDGSAARDLAEAREKWAASGTTNYLFRIKASCFCMRTGPTDILVKNGTAVVSDPDWWGPTTIPELFAEVERAIDRQVGKLKVKYRESDGLPEQIYVDWITEAVDDEMGYTVSNLVDLDKLPPVDPPVPPSGGAANRKQAIKIARKRIKQSSLGRGWKAGKKRSIVCKAKTGVFVCTAKWTFKGKRHSERMLVLRKKS